MKLNIVIPVLNEEQCIEKNVIKVIDYLNNTILNNDYIITIIDNGSTDCTEMISKNLTNRYRNSVQYIRLQEKGVGLAFRTGIINNKCDYIGYMDVDLSTDIEHILDVYNKLEDGCEIVIGSRLMSDSIVKNRSITRNITSRALNIILKRIFHVKFSDAMCGFKFFRKDIANYIVSISSNDNGWFYCAEMLIRAEWFNKEIFEIPIKWTDDRHSKVKIGKLSIYYLKEIYKLKNIRKQMVKQ